MPPRPRVALVLAGGNALGSYQAGVYQAMHEHEVEPYLIVGASAGAINGALIAGNARADRLARLRAFWQPGDPVADREWQPSGSETLRRSAAVAATLATGRPGVFGAIGPLGSWWDPDASAAAPSLFDSQPLAATLTQSVDLARLNAGTPRFVATAVDLDTGDEVVFDSAQQEITVEHFRASAALLPTFPPIAIGDRVFVDGGVSANLPLDAALGEPSTEPTLCIAVDLFPLAAPRPQSIGEAVGRAQDLTFALQSRRSIDHWRSVYAHDPRFAGASMTLVRLAYVDQTPEVAGKAMDFSTISTQHRWAAGYRDASKMLQDLDWDALQRARGLTVAGD